MLNIAKILPDKRSSLWKSPHKDEIFDHFEKRIVDVAELRSSVEEVAAEIRNIDPSVKKSSAEKAVSEGVRKVQRMKAMLRGLEPNEVSDVMANEEMKRENIDGIRRGTAFLFAKVIRNLIDDPTSFFELDPKTYGEWFNLIRREEDRERELLLKANAEKREDAKFKMMFFDFISGYLGEDDIAFLSEDLRNDIKQLLHATEIGTDSAVPEGVAAQPAHTGAQ